MGLRQHLQKRHQRHAGGRRQWLRRCLRRCSVPDPSEWRRGAVEPHRPLPRHLRRAPSCGGGGAAQWQLHPDHHAVRNALPLLPAGWQLYGPEQHPVLLPDGDQEPGTLGRQCLAGPRDPRPDRGAPPGLELQPRPAPRAPRTAVRLRHTGLFLGRTAHHRRPGHVQRRPGSLRLGPGRQEGNLHPLQQLPDFQPRGEIQGSDQARSHRPAIHPLRTAPGLGRRRQAQARRATHLQQAHPVP
ncbi:hypothetical protein D9M68_656770 [compost metagenome]